MGDWDDDSDKVAMTPEAFEVRARMAREWAERTAGGPSKLPWTAWQHFGHDVPALLALASAYRAGQAATPDGPRTWVDGLRRIADRARAEAAAGAPAGMVAWYVSVEAQHVGAEHDGDAQSCEECNQAASEDRARWTADATPAADGQDGDGRDG